MIDNCGVHGDAAVRINEFTEAVGPTSMAVGAAIKNAIIVDAVALLSGAGLIPPVFLSANIDGGEMHNSVMLEAYKDNINYMR